jgi:hypothetical protein
MKGTKPINLKQSAKMNAITSLYIPHVKKNINAEYIANIFSKNGLAQVSKIYLQPNYRYNRAFIEIESWNETEAAYSFIKRLRNPSTEARVVYSDDNWWTAEINKKQAVFTFKNRVLTVFPKKNVEDEVLLVVEDDDEDEAEEFVTIDAEKTKMLRDIVAKFKENYERQLMEQEEEDVNDFQDIVREIRKMRDDKEWTIEQRIFGY